MKIEYAFVNGEHSEVEVSEEIGKFILDSRRMESNSDRVYRRHNYSLERGLEDGYEYSECGSPYEFFTIIDAFESLTKILRNRLKMSIAGYTVREIAAIEGNGVTWQAVEKSIQGARKKIKKFL